MSRVRTAILKLAFIGIGGAAIGMAGAAYANSGGATGGGAVHVAEKASTTKPQYVKHAKPMPKKEVKPLVRARKHETAVASATTCPSTAEMEAAMQAGPDGPAKTGRVLMVPAYCFKIEQMAAIPMPPPAEATFIPGNAQQYTVMERENYRGPAGGFYTVQGTNLIVINNNTITNNNNGTPVPGPPMLVLFGAAAAALALRRKKVLAVA